MNNKLKFSACMLAVWLGISGTALAKSFPQPVREDARIRVVQFDPNNVVEIPTSFGFATTVEFGTEQIQTVVSGDTIGWQVVPQGNRLFIKPAEKPIGNLNSTNLTVITDKRNYYLHLTTGTRRNPAFIVRFDYSDAATAAAKRAEAAATPPEFRVNNYQYEITTKSGRGDIDVKAIFDDGQFTFFEFNPGTPLPAIYLVNGDGREELTNSRREGRFVVVEKVGRQFSLRLGNELRCVRNTARLPSRGTGNFNPNRQPEKAAPSRPVTPPRAVTISRTEGTPRKKP